MAVTKSRDFFHIPLLEDEDGCTYTTSIGAKDRRIDYSEEFENFLLFHIPFANNDFWIDIQTSETKYIDYEESYDPDDDAIFVNDEEMKTLCKYLPIAISKENFAPIEQRIIENVKKNYVYLEDPGENKAKVNLALKKETGLSFEEIRNRLDSNKFLIAEGYGENTKVLADYFISLGAIVKIEQK